MTTETYYRLDENGEYQSVLHYDSEVMDAMPVGTHLVTVYPGGRSVRCKVRPDWAMTLATLSLLRHQAAQVLTEAQQLEPSRRTVTPQQRAAWNAMLEAFEDEYVHGIRPSSQEAVDQMIEWLGHEVDQLLTRNPQVKSAHDRLRALIELCE